MANININAGDVSQKALRNSDSFHKQTDHRYVNFASGDDANNGSMYRPWKTLFKAITTTQAGHNVYFSGVESLSNFSITPNNNIAIIGESGAKFTGNITLNNCSGVTLDFDMVGALTLNQCTDIRIKQGANIGLVTANNHNGLLDITNNIDCNVLVSGAGTNLEVFVHENQGGVGAIQFQNGATGSITVKNSECDLVQATGAGVLNLRLENAYAPSGVITPVAGAITVDRWIDSTINNTDPEGANNAHTATTQAIVDYVATQTATSPETITHVCASGMNTAFVLTTKGLYSAAGNNAVFNSYTGRGNQGQPEYYGTTNIQKVPFVGKENGTVTQCHTNYCAQLALFSDGELWGWGRNNNGQLGLGDVVERPLPVLLKTGVAEILTNETASGYSPNDATQFIKDTDGWVWAAGRNGNGQMGLGDGLVKNTWTRLDWIGQNPLFVKPIGTTYGHLFVQKSDQTLWGVGFNTSGQLGNNATATILTPEDISDDWFGVGNTFPVFDIVGGGGYFDVSAKTQGFSIIVYDDTGTKVTKGAGTNEWGNLATGAVGGAFSVPQTIAAGDVKQISAIGGAPATISVVRNDGSLWNWGYNFNGQVGNGSTAVGVATPFNALNNIDEILRPEFASNTYSYGSSVFVRDNNGYCWACGYNVEGQLGIGTITDVSTFTRTLLAKQVKEVGQLATGGDGRGITTIFATDDNELYTCGYNAHNGVHMYNTVDVSSPVRVFYK